MKYAVSDISECQRDEYSTAILGLVLQHGQTSEREREEEGGRARESTGMRGRRRGREYDAKLDERDGDTKRLERMKGVVPGTCDGAVASD